MRLAIAAAATLALGGCVNGPVRGHAIGSWKYAVSEWTAAERPDAERAGVPRALLADAGIAVADLALLPVGYLTLPAAPFYMAVKNDAVGYALLAPVMVAVGAVVLPYFWVTTIPAYYERKSREAEDAASAAGRSDAGGEALAGGTSEQLNN